MDNLCVRMTVTVLPPTDTEEVIDLKPTEEETEHGRRQAHPGRSVGEGRE